MYHRAAPSGGALLALALLLLFLVAAAVTAQEPSAPAAAQGSEQIAVSGFMAPVTDEFMGLGLALSIFREGRNGLGLRWFRAEEFTLFADDPTPSVWDLSVLWLRKSGEGVVRGSAGIGPALTGGMRKGRYLGSDPGWFGTDHFEKDPFYTVGAVATVDLTVAVLPFLGVGVGVSGNLNPERSYAAAALAVSVGRLR